MLLESLQERREATGVHPGVIDTGGSHYGELVLSQGYWYWTGMCHSDHPSGPSPIHQPVASVLGYLSLNKYPGRDRAYPLEDQLPRPSATTTLGPSPVRSEIWPFKPGH